MNNNIPKFKSITAIICAFNEESTIENVLKAVADSNLFNEIILVNDGSTDDTGKIIKELKKCLDITDIHLPENKGKGFAMATGIEQSQSEIIVFLDADLTELSTSHFANIINQLIKPIVNNEADMVLVQPYVTILNYKINPFKSLTGERSVKRKDILPILGKMKNSKFGIETLINLYFQATGKIVKYVLLAELDHLSKFSKTSTLSASKQYIKEGQEIALTAFNNFNLISKVIKNNLNKL